MEKVGKKYHKFKEKLDSVDEKLLNIKYLQSGGGIPIYHISDNVSDNLIKCLLHGFFSQVACYKKGQLTTLHFNINVKTRDTNLTSKDTCLVYTELTILGKNNIVNVVSSVVKKGWFLEVAPKSYIDKITS
jgi:hypothetical protein